MARHGTARLRHWKIDNIYYPQKPQDNINVDVTRGGGYTEQRFTINVCPCIFTNMLIRSGELKVCYSERQT